MIIGKSLINNIRACEADNDPDRLIGYLLVALDKARNVKRLRDIQDDIEYLPTSQREGNDENISTMP